MAVPGPAPRDGEAEEGDAANSGLAHFMVRCGALTSCAFTFASMKSALTHSLRLRSSWRPFRSSPVYAQSKRPLALQVCGNMFEVDARYNPVKPIGKGAYGIVCSAQNDQTDEKVCVRSPWREIP